MAEKLKKEKSDIDIITRKGIQVEVFGKKKEIKPFVLRNRIIVVKTITSILKGILNSNPEILQSNDALAIGTVVVQEAGDKLIGIYAVILEETEEFILDNLVMKEEIALIEAVMEVNDLPFLISQVQRILKKKA